VQKNKKPSQQSYIRREPKQCPIPDPQVYDIDMLSTMLDEELSDLVHSLENDRMIVLEARFDPRFWEEEVAYARREQQLRRNRRESHDRYLSLCVDQSDVSEDDLPQGDFDNSAYVYAATNGRPPRWN